MKLRIWVRIFCTCSVVLLIAGVLGYISVSNLKRNAELIVQDTLPGLSLAGEANSYLADTSRTLLVIMTEDAGQRQAIRDEIAGLCQRTTGYLERYATQIDSEEDRVNYQALMDERKAYIQIRDQVLGLAVADKRNEALKLYSESMVPAHKRVKSAGDKLFEFNMHEGEVRGRNILATCTATQITVALLSVAVFLAGFFIGLFK